MKMNFVVLPSPFLIDDLIFPNLGILYLSAILKQNHYDVSIIDLHGHANDWKSEIYKYLNSDDSGAINNMLPDDDIIWGISCTTPEFPIAIQVLKEIKSFNNHAYIHIGGPMATCDPGICISSGFDQAIVGEGERAILKTTIQHCKDKIIREPLIRNIDDIPFPDRNSIDIHRYNYYINNKRSTSIVTSRGCYWSKCRFCCQIWEKRIRYRSAENVLKEINLLNQMGFEGIMISDDEFFSNKKRDFQICKGLKELDMSYRCLTRSDLINEDLAKLACDSNCHEILLGLESGSETILKTLNKGITKEQYKKAIKILHDYGINVKGLFVIGLPGESQHTIDETVEFIEETCPDICEFTIYTPYPHSDFWDNQWYYDIIFDKQKILDQGAWYKGKKGEYNCYVKTSSLTSEEIIERRDEMERRFGEV